MNYFSHWNILIVGYMNYFTQTVFVSEGQFIVAMVKLKDDNLKLKKIKLQRVAEKSHKRL